MLLRCNVAKAFFSDDAARRIVSATIKVEGMPLDHGAITSRYRGGDDSEPSIAVTKTTADWAYGSSQELTIYEGTPPGEAAPATSANPLKVTAWNRTGDVKSGKWVVIGKAHADTNGKDVWYLVSTQCSKVEVVTDIKCAGGKIEVTKEFFWMIPYGTTP